MTHERTPDYAGYSDAELKQALKSLDVRSYPERAAQIREEIERRMDAGISPKAEATGAKEDDGRSFHTSIWFSWGPLVMYALASSGLAIFAVLDAFSPELLGTQRNLVLIVVAIFALQLLSTLMIFLRLRTGFPLLFVAASAHSVMFRIGTTEWMVAPPGAGRFWLAPDFSLEFDLVTRISVFQYDQPQEFALGLNVVSILLVGLALFRSFRSSPAIQGNR